MGEPVLLAIQLTRIDHRTILGVIVGLQSNRNQLQELLRASTHIDDDNNMFGHEGTHTNHSRFLFPYFFFQRLSLINVNIEHRLLMISPFGIS